MASWWLGTWAAVLVAAGPATEKDPPILTVQLLQPPGRGFLFATAPLPEMKARIVFNMPPAPAGWTAEASLERPEGTVLARKPLPLNRPEYLLTFPLPPLQPDDQLYLRVVVRETAPPGRLLCQEVRTLRRLHPAWTEVTFDPHRTLLINGQPFFPIGIDHSPPEELSRLAEMGFNCVGPDVHLTPEYAAAAEKAGLRMLSSVPAAADLTATLREIGRFHHVLLGYSLFDEPQPDRQSREQVQALCDQVATVDGYHPTLGRNSDHFDTYAGTSDVMLVGSDPLPGPLQPLAERLEAAVRAMAGRGPVWWVPRIWGWQAGEPPAGGRPPTFDEVRTVTWLGIVHGAQGIIYDAYPLQTFPMRRLPPATWRGLGYVGRELKALSGFLIVPPVRRPATAYPPGLDLQARQREGEWFLIAVNRQDTPLVSRVTVPGLGNTCLAVIGEGRPVACAEGAFTDAFPPHTVHLYTTAPPPDLPPLAAVRAECEALEPPARDRAERPPSLFPPR